MTPAILAALLASTAAPANPPASGPPAVGTAEEAFITITAPALPGRVATPLVGLSADALLDRQPRSVGDALRGLPGVSIRTNSRGETSPRVRGGDERQTLVFLDGAPLVVPWDGRLDLGLIPAGIIGSVQVRKGAGAIEYGVNAVAGTVDLQSRSSGLAAQAQAGPYGLANLSAAAAVPVAGLTLTMGAAHQAQSALPVAQAAVLPFSQPASGSRLNSDLAATSWFAALAGSAGPLDWRASLLHIDARRGVVPESDRDPAIAPPRYWRTPDWQLSQAQIALEVPIGAATARAVAWRQWFGQTITSFRDARYTLLNGREVNDDDTLGGRLTLRHTLGSATLRWSLSGQISDHSQTDTALPAGTMTGPLRYRQSLASGGLEADVPLGSAALTVGLGLDASTNPFTGNKPAQPARQAATFSAAMAVPLNDAVQLTLSGGRRNRFASARELFGEALGRFLPNPALTPERVWLSDAELVWRRGGAVITLNPFWQRVDGSIGQRIVTVNGAALRQRFNQGAATSIGIDLALQLPLSAGLTLEITGNAQHASSGGQPLLQRPFHEAMAAIDWAPSRAFDLRAEVRRIGPARDLGRDLAPRSAAAGQLARLPPATEINLRSRVLLTRIGKTRLSATAALDNLLNAAVFPQLGLPLPGRSFRIGVLLAN